LPVVIDSEFRVIAGWAVVQAAQRLELPQVPCIAVTGLGEAQLRALRLALNRLAEDSKWDKEAVKAELSEILSFVIDTLARSIEPEFAKKPGAQIFGFFGAGLPRGSRLWSKAGRTDWTGDPAASYRRHDAAYIELPGGPAFTLVAFTQGKAVSLDETVLPMIARTTADLLVT
jgi:hypothetical protein